MYIFIRNDITVCIMYNKYADIWYTDDLKE